MTPMKRIIKADTLTKPQRGKGSYDWDLGLICFFDPLEATANKAESKRKWLEKRKATEVNNEVRVR